jgi:hypothetical protein
MFHCRSHLHFEKNFVLINFIIALILALAFFTTGIDQSSNKVNISHGIRLIVYLLSCNSANMQDNDTSHALFLPGHILLDAV